MKTLVRAVLGFILLMAIITAIHESMKTDDEKAAEAVANEKRHRVGAAEAACQILAERQAHDPKSIDWLRDERTFRYDNKAQTKATSQQPMRAKNAMGALVRTGVSCQLTRDQDSESWDVTRIRTLK